MGYHLTIEPENAVPGKSFVSPKTHTPGPQVQERGLRFHSPTLGRWISRDPIEEEGGVNLFAFVSNGTVGRYDYLGLDAPGEDCMKMPRDQFEKWLADHGMSTDSFVKNMLDHGCIGLTCIDQGTGGYPENEPDTKCWMNEDAARKDCAVRCPKTPKKCCTVFAKQGKWKGGKPPKKRPDGSISCHEVESATPGENDWNYILSKNGWYLWANTGKVPGKTQIFTICKKLPDYDYPAMMWGASCVKIANMPTP
jgi:RHS repeat-associated protein